MRDDGPSGFPLVDLLLLEEEVKAHGEPRQGERVMCSEKVVELLELVWDGKPTQDPPSPSIAEIRGQAMKELNNLRHDHVRFLNPTPYKVSLSEDLFTMMHELWRTEAPIAELT
ncbi:hypothetical protein GUITHDRAFT_147313 [Guillardia theta CCMP2712]|uniref:nicotinate phosphoribosyltransferase n=1 Tax=Guillardia theta (strain CCMP2712) TaxID=905079 RepID=L1IE34_GUITC|nr:hypothetical protein GUITHDRAFT_147313 [Guillardia theta CCMP2712]EKX34342.1 hypothetical protein GUITHDRAFT_147313 [Guillardia theta CCMP2712]|eukprot:XP_005821322.1 hypothetical protein GUITHDRAFT_147313 [Guillardia theta CCMP2712]